MVYLLIVLVTITSCTKAVSDEFVSYPNNAQNDTVWSNTGINFLDFSKLIILLQSPTTVIDSFNATIDNTLTFGDSLQTTFGAGSCITKNGAIITSTGKVKIEITLLRKKGDFLKYGVPTTSNLALLEPGNFLHISLSKDGEEVFLTPNSKVKIRIKDTAVNSNMKFFTGDYLKYNRDTIFSWSPSVDGKVEIWKNTNNMPRGYEFTTNKLRWVGCSFYADSLQPKTRLNVVLPSNYTNKNTAVFLVFKHKKIVVNLLNDALTKTFFTQNIPVGTEATLVSLTKINTTYYLGSKPIKATNGDVLQLLPEKKSLEQIIAYLNSL